MKTRSTWRVNAHAAFWCLCAACLCMMWTVNASRLNGLGCKLSFVIMLQRMLFGFVLQAHRMRGTNDTQKKSALNFDHGAPCTRNSGQL